MRIAVFTDTYLPTVDGVVNSIRSAKDTLEAMGHEVLIIAPGEKSESGRGGRTLYCRSRELRRYPGYRIAIYPTRREQEFLRACNADLIHSHGIAFMGLKGMWAARELNLPMAVTFHTMVQDAIPHYTSLRAGSHLLERLLSIYIKSFLHRCGAVIAPTRAVLNELQKIAPHMRRTAVVPSGVDVERFRPDLDGAHIRDRYGLEDAEVVLHVGRVAPEKDIEFLLEAFPQLQRRRPGLRLLIVGQGPALGEYRRLVTQRGLQDRILFTGFVPDDELPLHYAASDVLATASAFETQGLAVLEGMACGKPVVALNYRAFPECITDGDNGFLFAPGSGDGFCDAVERALDAGDDLRQRARETAEGFSLETCTKKLLALYDEMLS